MNSYQTQTQLLKALAHPERLRLLNSLRDGEECVCHLTALLRKRQAYVSQQLSYLRDAGLIRDRKEGLRVYYTISEPRLYGLLDEVARLSGTAGALDEGAGQHPLPSCTCPHCGAA